MSELSAKSIVVGTAGHIDHGKTALVKALTGIDADRLPEEKRRGITIDLGFASTTSQAEDGGTVTFSFVDVPGHKLFVHNMLAGAAGIDCVMLVISAEEGIKPQTIEHLDICTLLGIHRGLIVLTKADKVSANQLAQARSAIENFRRETVLRNAPVVIVSAQTGQGLPELDAELQVLAAKCKTRAFASAPRLPIDRAFVLNGFGTIVTGTLQSGSIQRGQNLMIQPSGQTVKVRGLHIHNREQQEARAGTRIALNLTGVEVADVQRGDTLVLSASYVAQTLVDVEIQLLSSSPPLRDHSEIKFHCFTSEVLGFVTLSQGKSLEPGETALARVKLAEGVVVLPGDRFVLRQCSPAQTIGGGRIIDAHPLPRLSRLKRFEWLDALRDCPDEQKLLLRIQRRQTTGIALNTLSNELGWPVERMRSVLDGYIRNRQIIEIGENCYLAQQSLETAKSRILAVLGTHQQRGLKRSELRHSARLNEAVFEFAAARLVTEKKVEVRGDLIYPFGAANSFPPAEQRKLAAIVKTFANAGLATPSPQSVGASLNIPDAEMRKLMTILLRDKVLVKIGTEELYVQREALIQLQNKVRGLKGQTLDVAKFKELTGLTRKYAIPLLEHLDRERITRKQGESRVVI